MKIKRIQMKLSEQENEMLRKLAEKTGLKMTTIFVKGLELMNEKYNQNND